MEGAKEDGGPDPGTPGVKNQQDSLTRGTRAAEEGSQGWRSGARPESGRTESPLTEAEWVRGRVGSGQMTVETFTRRPSAAVEQTAGQSMGHSGERSKRGIETWGNQHRDGVSSLGAGGGH